MLYKKTNLSFKLNYAFVVFITTKCNAHFIRICVKDEFQNYSPLRFTPCQFGYVTVTVTLHFLPKYESRLSYSRVVFRVPQPKNTLSITPYKVIKQFGTAVCESHLIGFYLNFHPLFKVEARKATGSSVIGDSITIGEQIRFLKHIYCCQLKIY